jgi:ABC-type multidrug transport system fused ATPase/permease subunit
MERGGDAVKGTGRDDTPVLITEAAPSYDDQHANRKRKYMVMMAMRVPFLILALVFYQTWWLALCLVLLSVPLPWAAVLIANDRPALKAEKVNRYQRSNRAIESGGHTVVEG